MSQKKPLVPWTPEERELLITYIGQGMSSRVAGALLGRTKNSVISYAGRTGIELPIRRGYTTANGQRPPPRKKLTHKKLKLATPPHVALKKVVEVVPTKVYGKHLRRIDELGRDQCKFPELVDQYGEWLLCANDRDAESPYCSHHGKLCFRRTDKLATGR